MTLTSRYGCAPLNFASQHAIYIRSWTASHPLVCSVFYFTGCHSPAVLSEGSYQHICDSKGSYSATSCRKDVVRKWLQMFPALYTNSPPGPRSSAVSGWISLYSTTWETPRTLQTTPTGSAGYAFSTTWHMIEVRGQMETGVNNYDFLLHFILPLWDLLL